MKKRLLSLLLCILLVLPLLSVVLADDGNGNVGGEIFDDLPAKLSIASVTAEPGQTVTVAVTMAQNPGVAGMKLTFACGQGLTILDIRPAELLTGGQWTCDPENGQAAWNSDANAGGNGDLLYLDVALSADAQPGAYALSMGIDRFVNARDKVLPVAIFGGTVTAVPWQWHVDINGWDQTADLTITHRDPSIPKAVAVLAVYDRNNKLLSAHAQAITLPTAQSQFHLPTGELHRAALYLLEPETLRPLTELLPVTFKNEK